MNTNDIEYNHYKVSLKFEGISDVMIYAKSVDEAEEIALTLPIIITEHDIEIERRFTNLDISGNTLQVDPNECSWCEEFYRSYFILGHQTISERFNEMFDN